MTIKIVNPNKMSKPFKIAAALFAENERKKHSAELGFVPKSTYKLAIARNRLLVAINWADSIAIHLRWLITFNGLPKT